MHNGRDHIKSNGENKNGVGRQRRERNDVQTDVTLLNTQQLDDECDKHKNEM